MKLYRSPPNNSDGIFSVSFPYRFRIVSVSFPYQSRIVSVSIPYRSPIILLSSSYCEAENNTEWIEKLTNEVRRNKGGQFYYLFISKILLQWQDSMEFFPNLKVL